MKKEALKRDFFEKLNWDDLEQWAGSRVLSRGQGYHRSHRVKELAQARTGALVAWVHGGQRYATEVDFEDGELISVCTCPYGNNCKHAVAVVLEYLDHLKKKLEVPQVTGQDQRLALLQGIDEEDPEDRYEEEEIDSGPLVPQKGAKSSVVDLKGFLEEQTKGQLITLLTDLSERYPNVREDLEDRQTLSKGSVKRIVAAVRKEIQALSSEPGWRNHWNDEGYTPDYSRVKGRLKSLLVKGHADEVIALGKELQEAGIRQVEMSHDEGETGMEISSCLDVVFQTLPQSSLSPIEQMLWVIDAELKDDYELCYGSESFWKKKQKASDWSAVADKLMQRLNEFDLARGEDNFSRNYRRDRLSNWIIEALENAGRHKEIIPLCEEEAVKTGSYTRLVDALRKAKRLEEAEQWIFRGIRATQKQWPGIAKQLKDTLREMREREGNWLKVAAFRTEDFLQSPSLHTFQDMKKAAEKAKVWPEVRAAALLYLETGKLPQSNPTWPLPQTGVKEDRETRKSEFPMADVLIDIAIEEKRPDEVLRWYDQRKSKKQIFWGGDGYQEDKIAGAVVDLYPDRAIAIWKNLAEKQIALTKPKAYEAAAIYLRKVYSLLKKLKKEGEWKDYLLKLRQANARKTKFIEILDRVEGRRI
ncbi:MAG: SWIM zinc finger family protein, partial [Thermodesulfobacteriota bacterium]